MVRAAGSISDVADATSRSDTIFARNQRRRRVWGVKWTVNSHKLGRNTAENVASPARPVTPETIDGTTAPRSSENEQDKTNPHSLLSYSLSHLSYSLLAALPSLPCALETPLRF